MRETTMDQDDIYAIPMPMGADAFSEMLKQIEELKKDNAALTIELLESRGRVGELVDKLSHRRGSWDRDFDKDGVKAG